MIDKIIRVLCFALLGSGIGAAGIFWVRAIVKKRNLTYELNQKTEWIFVLVMALPGGLLGALTAGWIVPISGLILSGICGAAALTDLIYRIIPNETVLAVIGLKLLFGLPTVFGAEGFLPFDPVQSLLGLVVCFLLFSLPGLFGKKVGAGDIKLAGAMGFFLGLRFSLIGVVIMGLLVIGFSLVQGQMPVLKFLKEKIPMGPFITAGLFTAFIRSVSTLFFAGV